MNSMYVETNWQYQMDGAAFLVNHLQDNDLIKNELEEREKMLVRYHWTIQWHYWQTSTVLTSFAIHTQKVVTKNTILCVCCESKVYAIKCGVKFNGEWCKWIDCNNKTTCVSELTHFPVLLHSINGHLVCFGSDRTRKSKGECEMSLIFF